jgi:hypothetical protein
MTPDAATWAQGWNPENCCKRPDDCKWGGMGPCDPRAYLLGPPRDYGHYDRLQRDHGLPYAYKLVVNEAMSLLSALTLHAQAAAAVRDEYEQIEPCGHARKFTDPPGDEFADCHRCLSESAEQRLAQAVRAENEACIAALCDRCAHGEPILAAAECARLGHPSVGGCHEYRGVTTVAHISCRATAIRARREGRG